MHESPHGWRQGKPDGIPIPSLGREAVEIAVKYSNYLARQHKEVRLYCAGLTGLQHVCHATTQSGMPAMLLQVEKIRANQMTRIPNGFDYASLPCLSAEEVVNVPPLQFQSTS